MQGRHPENKIILEDEDRKKLEKIANSRTVEFRLVQRAQIILLAAEGKYRNTEIGEKVGCNRITVRKWRRRFRESGMDGLKDMPRSGHPPEFTAQERAKVLAMATRKPEDEGKHFTDWSIRELAGHVVEKGIVESISPTTVFRWLKDADIKPHKWEYWLNSNDPDFLKK
jgi:transposase